MHSQGLPAVLETECHHKHQHSAQNFLPLVLVENTGRQQKQRDRHEENLHTCVQCNSQRNGDCAHSPPLALGLFILGRTLADDCIDSKQRRHGAGQRTVHKGRVHIEWEEARNQHRAAGFGAGRVGDTPADAGEQHHAATDTESVHDLPGTIVAVKQPCERLTGHADSCLERPVAQVVQQFRAGRLVPG